MLSILSIENPSCGEYNREQKRTNVFRRGRTMTNNELFNVAINRCKDPRRVYRALLGFAKPGIQKADDMDQKRKILVGELLTFLDIPQGDQ